MPDRNCPICGEDLIRLDKWDCSACRKCNIWTEDICMCEACPYPDRPEKPDDKPDWDNPNNSLGYCSPQFILVNSYD